MGKESTYFKPGQIPQNKVFNAEKEKFLIENFRTMNNVDLAKHVGIQSAKSVRRKMREMGLNRTPQEIQKLVADAKGRIDHKKCAIKRLKIEGGSRSNDKKSIKIKYHKDKWIQKNGPIPKGMTLVYENGKYDDFSDLLLIKNKSYNSFIKKRDIRLRKEDRKKKTAVTAHQAQERRKRFEKQEMLQEQLKANHKQKSFGEAVTEQLESEKVPVRLDHKTLIFVKKEKCYQDESGNWHKKI
jgi:hypothetical protein